MPIKSRFNFFILCFLLKFYYRLLPPLDEPELLELPLEDLEDDPELDELELLGVYVELLDDDLE